MLGICALGGLVAAAEPFTYHGFTIDTALATLTARFPKSGHEFCCRNGFNVYPNSGDAFREFIARGTGNYLIRLSEAESFGHIYYVGADLKDGAVSQIRLSFERPDHIKQPRGYPEVGFRNPACAPVLAELTKLYGRPSGPVLSHEEALENKEYSWTGPSQELALVCGQYQSRRGVFAMEVLFRRR
jgi:hypothetical protein